MKPSVKLFLMIVLIGLFSCESKDSSENKESYIDFLADKSIESIKVLNDARWIYSLKICETCDVPAYSSYLPITDQLTLITNSSYEYVEPAQFHGTPNSDSKGNLYIANYNSLYRCNDFNTYTSFLVTGDFNFLSYVFDPLDNIWFYGNNGIAFWDQTELRVYNTTNSQLPTDIIHSMAIDRSGAILAAMDFKGLLKISSGNWEIIPNSEIPGLGEYSYIQVILTDNSDNIWFEVFNPDTTSNVLRLKNNEWAYEFPGNEGDFHLEKDSKGIIWAIHNHFENNEFQHTTLRFYSNNEWVEFDNSGIHTRVLTVNADNDKVYIGTTKGLIEKIR